MFALMIAATMKTAQIISFAKTTRVSAIVPADAVLTRIV